MSVAISTMINLCLTSISVFCALFSARQTRRQTDIMARQLEEAMKPNWPVTNKLETISKAIWEVNSTLQDNK